MLRRFSYIRQGTGWIIGLIMGWLFLMWSGEQEATPPPEAPLHTVVSAKTDVSEDTKPSGRKNRAAGYWVAELTRITASARPQTKLDPSLALPLLANPIYSRLLLRFRRQRVSRFSPVQVCCRPLFEHEIAINAP